MKKRTIAALLGLAIAAAPAANAAETLSYNYVEGSYIHSSADAGDGYDISADGFGFNASVAFADTGLYGIGAYETVGDEVEGIDFDIKRWTVGLGYAAKIDKDLHFLVEAAYIDYQLDASDGFDSLEVGADGYRANIGVRGLMADNIEGIAKVGYVNVEEQGIQVLEGAVGEVGIRWHIDSAWSAGLTAEIADQETTYKLGVRAQW